MVSINSQPLTMVDTAPGQQQLLNKTPSFISSDSQPNNSPSLTSSASSLKYDSPQTPASRPRHTHRAKPSQINSFAKHQTRISLLLILAVLALHQLPACKPYTSKLLFASYVDPSTGLASIGTDDIYFVLFSIVVLTFARSIIVDHILRFVALRAHIKKKKLQARFVEQGWSVFYYTISFSVGIYILYISDYWMSASDMWRGWPHYQLPVLTKAYYLIQLACWFQQIYVLHIEERRKDHVQMFTHHIITCALIIGSYYYYYTRVGHVILILMDVVDIQLSLAKVLNYLELKRVCDATFIIFMVSWMICRHVFYNYIVWSAMTSAFELIPVQCYYGSDGQEVRCFTPAVHWTLVSLLLALQVITIFWFVMIVRVAISVVRGSPAADSRSDEESEEENALEEKNK